MLSHCCKRDFSGYQLLPCRLVLLCCLNLVAKFEIKSSPTSRANWLEETIPFPLHTGWFEIQSSRLVEGKSNLSGGWHAIWVV